MKNKTILPKIHELKNNTIGNLENDKAREKAMGILEAVKQNEKDKIKKGFVWVIKDKISKLVSPDKLKQCKIDGFKPIKKIK